MNKLLLALVALLSLWSGATAQTVTRAYAIRMWADNASDNRPALVSFDIDNGSFDENGELDVPLGFFSFDVTNGKATLIRTITIFCHCAFAASYVCPECGLAHAPVAANACFSRQNVLPLGKRFL